MRVVRSIKQMSGISRRIRAKGKRLGFVATMGALHAGHLSLIRKARRENDFVAVSIFVNPAQFGPKEDFKKYPRNLKLDAQLCQKEGVDIIFYPSAKEIYPEGYKTYVEVQDLSKVLCGGSRPGHFRGVATAVAKLFNIVRPDIAYFGQKDAQQAVIIKKMVSDLNMSVKIKVMPTVREKDGLAISSRNMYLNPGERKDALVLSQALNLASDLAGSGIRDARKIINRMSNLIKTKKTAKIEYVSIVDSENLAPLEKIKDRALIALVVRIGKTRLIDNVIISKGRFLS